jgi:predicted dehydrogenase
MAMRIGFIGVGGISRKHRQALQQMDDVDIAAVCDADPKRTQAAAKEHDAKPYADWKEMLSAEPLDALYICVPPFAHGEMELAAVEKGLPMYIEKPLAADWATAVPIARAVADAGLTVGVGYQWRYSPATERAREYLSGVAAGAMLGYWTGGMPGVSWWRRKDGSGGQVIEQSTHIADLIRYLSGAEATRVFAAGFRGVMGKKVEDYSVDDASAAVIQLDNGVIATLTSACMMPLGHRVGLDVLTERGVVRVDGGSVAIEEADNRERFENPEGFSTHGRGSEVFMEALRKGDAALLLSDFADAMKTFALTCAIQASIDRGGEAVELAEFSV